MSRSRGGVSVTSDRIKEGRVSRSDGGGEGGSRSERKDSVTSDRTGRQARGHYVSTV